MTRRFYAILAAAIALLTIAPGGAVSAADPAQTPDPQAAFKLLEEASKPGPEHQKLQPLVGKWTYTAKMWMDPSHPPTESTGTIERKWILGERFVEENIQGKGPAGAGEFEGRGTIGYDKNLGRYTYGWMCTMGTGTANGFGAADDNGKHFIFETETFCPVQQKQVKMRDEIQIESNDKHVLTSYQIVGGEEVKFMELTAVRQK